MSKKKGNVICLIQVYVNKDGDIRPVDYSHCPLFINHLVQTTCTDGDRWCLKGWPSHGVIKKLIDKTKEHDEIHLIQCDYYVNTQSNPPKLVLTSTR